MEIDLDRNEDSFALYKKLYKGLPWSLFDFSMVDRSRYCYAGLKTKDQIGFSIPPQYEELVAEYGGRFRLSGDADFGMKKKRGCVFNDETYEIAKAELKDDPCDKMHKSFNFSLIPIEGGMNKRKGMAYKDIFPRFLFILSEYYSINSCQGDKKKYLLGSLCSPSMGGRRPVGISDEEWDNTKKKRYDIFCVQELPALSCFLEVFDGFGDYCEKVYFWGNKSDEISKLLKDMCKFGGEIKGINDNNVKDYCKLAKRYWDIRNSIIKSLCDSQESM